MKNCLTWLLDNKLLNIVDLKLQKYELCEFSFILLYHTGRNSLHATRVSFFTQFQLGLRSRPRPPAKTPLPSLYLEKCPIVVEKGNHGINLPKLLLFYKHYYKTLQKIRISGTTISNPTELVNIAS